ncbi:MAG: hypothetical protein CMP91_11930 [Gammaproteobacteria bacterium]|nr:hypothetical protein [Gammaproteobacteria bacterium]|tara:strand:- start:3970 stop:4824 length:855 start_codon:yes stop_codon:yes gene_type:complete
MGMVNVKVNVKTQDKGYALVLVLWLITLLSLVTAMSYNAARVQMRLTYLANSQLEGEALAEAGIWLSVNTLLSTSSNNLGRYTNYTGNLQYHQSDISVSIRDLASLINLNNANAELLELLITPYTESSQETETLIQNIRDWIDSDNDSQNNSSEERLYSLADLDYSPMNKPFSSVDELRLVIGMTDALFRNISPFLTIYGTHTQINSQSAEPVLLELLNNESSDNNSIQRYLTTLPSNAFIVTSTATINGNDFSQTVIIELTGRRADSYRILAWQPSELIKKNS